LKTKKNPEQMPRVFFVERQPVNTGLFEVDHPEHAENGSVTLVF
jgi:hypothetical protein